VATDTIVRPERLAGRTEIEQLISDPGS